VPARLKEKKEHIMKLSIETTLAVSAAALFLAACSKGGDTEGAKSADSATADIKCMGVNECKGQGACGVSGGHSCAGQNECKGKGWVQTTAEDCAAKGGTVL
jgi:hypothetical protein